MTAPVDPHAVDEETGPGEAGPLAASLVVALLISSPMTVGALRGTTSAGSAMTAFVASLAAVWALAAVGGWLAVVAGRTVGRSSAERAPAPTVAPSRAASPAAAPSGTGVGDAATAAGRVD